MSRVRVRYIVNDVDAAIPFYTDMLGFKVEMHPAPGLPARRAAIYNCCSIGRAPATLIPSCSTGSGCEAREKSSLVVAEGFLNF